MSVFTQTVNPITGSLEWVVSSESYDNHQEIARSAFADMLHDTERNQKYFHALEKAIKKMHAQGKQANVLDIGTGTGLLSIMAEKCGADTITACDAFQPAAECAVKILKHNNVGDKIKIIYKRSTDLVVGVDMAERANILVTEVFDTELIGEGALETFTHAVENLLEKDCIVVPHSATIYAQVVECPTLQKWNKLNDLYDEDFNIVLKTPKKIRSCPGSAALHDIQLSQLPLSSFTSLSNPIPVFHFDWAQKKTLNKVGQNRTEITCLKTGVAQMVFMWWDLQMDTEGEILLSCAPWWNHPDAKRTDSHPEDTIPWRDHWMQAVYYLPEDVNVDKDEKITLISNHDEFSLWYNIENKSFKQNHQENPVCDCGAHIILSRTHVSYLNDGRCSKKLLKYLRKNLDDNSVVLCLNGASFLGLAAAVLKAKKVFIVEERKFVKDILDKYEKENDLQNVYLVGNDVSNEILSSVTHVICDPNFTDAILPWDNLKFGHLLHKFSDKLGEKVKIMPKSCTIWAMATQFLHLHKIRTPLNSCEGVDMSVYDQLVENARSYSDDEFEAQPLWEYPGYSRGRPHKLITIQFDNLKQCYEANGSFENWSEESYGDAINGIAVWMTWDLSEKDSINFGPLIAPDVNERVTWNPHTRQAVKLFVKDVVIDHKTKFEFKINCNLSNGSFYIEIR